MLGCRMSVKEMYDLKKKCTFLAKTFLLFTYRIQMCFSLLKTCTGVRCSVTQHTHIGPIQRVVTFFLYLVSCFFR
jgi:hypothetical protein